MSVAAHDPTAFEVLAERYRLGEELGQGSTATVYAAVDLRFDRAVTVKVFDAAIAEDPVTRARFERQAAKAARLRHPRIAAILDAGIAHDAQGRERPFVVTEPAGPENLRTLLGRRGRLKPARAVELARQIAAALSHAHGLGVIHADLKPENVLLDRAGGRLKLVDFSLSFVSARTGAVTRETIARRAAYLAPEQVLGQPAAPTTDVYGLGVLLYEMVAGRPPFIGDSPSAVAERRVYEQARPAGLYDPSLPPALEAIILRALERTPGARWASVDELGAALARLSPAELASRAPPPEPAERPAERPASWPAGLRSLLTGRAGLLAPLVGALVAFWLMLSFVGPVLRGVGLGLVSVPNVEGLTVAEARALTQSRGLELQVIGDRPTGQVPRDQIVNQAPIAGRSIDRREPVRVTVSAGVLVPDVRGLSLENAQAALSASRWQVAKVDRAKYPGQPAGVVVMQYPPPGQLAPEPGEVALAVAE